MDYIIRIKSNDGFSEIGSISFDGNAVIFPIRVTISTTPNTLPSEIIVTAEDSYGYGNDVYIRTGYKVSGLSSYKNADTESIWEGQGGGATLDASQFDENGERIYYVVDRSVAFFEYQYPTANINRKIEKNEIVMLPCDQKVAYSDFKFSSFGNCILQYTGASSWDYIKGIDLTGKETPSLVGLQIDAKCQRKKMQGDFILNVWDRPTGGLSYRLSDDGSYYICNGLGSAEKTDIVIASEIDGKPVKEIDNDAFGRTNITSIKIPPSVTTIAFGCLADCQQIRHISAPFIGKTIGDRVSIPSWFGSASNVDGTMGSNSLKSVQIYGTMGLSDFLSVYGAFAGCPNLETIHLPPTGVYLNLEMFYRCHDVTSIMFYGSVRQFNALPKTNNWAAQLRSLDKVTCSDGYVDISQWKG